ncbi:MAG: HAD family phosphatase [Nanoarchaeota archaeon]
MIKGIAYDLDGTIIDSEPVHRSAWIKAAAKTGISLSEEMLMSQRGKTDAEFTRTVHPSFSPDEINEFVALKQGYVSDTILNAVIFPGFQAVLNELQTKNIPVGICTSAGRWFVDKVIEKYPFLKIVTISSDMVSKGKPDPEPILLTFKNMGVKIEEGLYIGDAYNDYLAAKAAGCDFVHFGALRDPRVPKDVPGILRHEEIKRFLS